MTDKNLTRKLLAFTIVFLLLAPFFTHVWDMTTLTTSLNLFDRGINIYQYYADKSKELQRASGLPVFFEGYTYTITDVLIFYPFYKIYTTIFGDPLPISTDNLTMNLLTVNFSPNFMIYNLIMKLPLLIFFLVTFYLVEQEKKSSFLNFLMYPLFITAVLGMADIIVGLFLLICVLSFVRKRFFLSGLAFGLSAFKLYPLIVLPYILFVLIRDRQYKGLLTFLIGFLLVNIPSILYVAQDLNSFYVAVVQLQLNRIAGGVTPMNVLWAIPNFNFDYTASQIYSIVLIISYLIILFFTLGKTILFEEGILLTMLILLLFSKVVNEQFLLSIFPLLAIADSRIAKILGIVVIAFALVRINPIYFSAPVLEKVLTNYQSFVQDYYQFITRFDVSFSIWITAFVISVLFSLLMFTFVLQYHMTSLRRREELIVRKKDVKKQPKKK